MTFSLGWNGTKEEVKATIAMQVKAYESWAESERRHIERAGRFAIEAAESTERKTSGSCSGHVSATPGDGSFSLSFYVTTLAEEQAIPASSSQEAAASSANDSPEG